VHMRSVLPALIVATALAGAAFAATAPRDRLIVPGVRVGPIALGMSPAELTASVGGPAEAQHQGPDTIYAWGDLAAEISEKSPDVDLITVNDTRYETADHIRVGLAALAVIAVLGDPVKTTNALGIQNLDYDGMTIVIRNNLVAQIRVRK
jgi:LmbE family N-acetylglucosaminyl deacetylase